MEVQQYIKPPKCLSHGIYIEEGDGIHSKNKQTDAYGVKR